MSKVKLEIPDICEAGDPIVVTTLVHPKELASSCEDPKELLSSLADAVIITGIALSVFI